MVTKAAYSMTCNPQYFWRYLQILAFKKKKIAPLIVFSQVSYH